MLEGSGPTRSLKSDRDDSPRELGEKPDLAVVDNVVKNGTAQDMRIAAEYMGSTRNRVFLPLAVIALKRPEATQSIVNAVAFCGDKDALPALQEALDHPDKYVRYSAQMAIDRMNRPPRNMPQY